MSAPQNIVAVVFDFDDTLTDDSTTALLESRGVDTQKFWKTEVKSLVDAGWDPTLAYLHLMLKMTAAGQPLAGLSNANLRDFGKTLAIYTGLPKMFTDLREMMSQYEQTNPSIEFYVLSGGLEEIIRGSKIAPYMKQIWGCRFHEEPIGVVSAVKNLVSFTEKTKFLFQINKGIIDGRDKPYDVNKGQAAEDRRIPFKNMIYVGDGLTDVPCFSLLNRSHGRGFGVFDPSKAESPKKALEQLVAPSRVQSLNAPKYKQKDELGALIRAAVNQICVELELGRQAAVH